MEVLGRPARQRHRKSGRRGVLTAASNTSLFQETDVGAGKGLAVDGVPA